MKYRKINKEDILELLIGTSLDFLNPLEGAVSLRDIKSFLKTSKYQVDKYIKILREEELITLKVYDIEDEYEYYPPYWGYKITDKVKDSDKYIKRKTKHDKIFNECFNMK